MAGEKRAGWATAALGVTAVVCGLVLGDVLDPDRVTAAATVAGAGIAVAVRLRERRPRAGRDGSGSSSPTDEGEPDPSSVERS